MREPHHKGTSTGGVLYRPVNARPWSVCTCSGNPVGGQGGPERPTDETPTLRPPPRPAGHRLPPPAPPTAVQPRSSPPRRERQGSTDVAVNPHVRLGFEDRCPCRSSVTVMATRATRPVDNVWTTRAVSTRGVRQGGADVDALPGAHEPNTGRRRGVGA